jgi:hypothetical protein
MHIFRDVLVLVVTSLFPVNHFICFKDGKTCWTYTAFLSTVRAAACISLLTTCCLNAGSRVSVCLTVNFSLSVFSFASWTFCSKMFAGTKNSIPSVRFPSHHYACILPCRRSHFTVLYRPFPVPFGTLHLSRISRVLPYFPIFFTVMTTKLS